MDFVTLAGEGEGETQNARTPSSRVQRYRIIILKFPTPSSEDWIIDNGRKRKETKTISISVGSLEHIPGRKFPAVHHLQTAKWETEHAAPAKATQDFRGNRKLAHEMSKDSSVGLTVPRCYTVVPGHHVEQKTYSWKIKYNEMKHVSCRNLALPIWAAK